MERIASSLLDVAFIPDADESRVKEARNRHRIVENALAQGEIGVHPPFIFDRQSDSDSQCVS
jgi:hypothetical protein